MAQYKRVYVEVEVQFISDGSMRPCALIWRDGRKYEIERILDVRPACAQKAGGQGDRYKVKRGIRSASCSSSTTPKQARRRWGDGL